MDERNIIAGSDETTLVRDVKAIIAHLKTFLLELGRQTHTDRWPSMHRHRIR